MQPPANDNNAPRGYASEPREPVFVITMSDYGWSLIVGIPAVKQA